MVDCNERELSKTKAESESDLNESVNPPDLQKFVGSREHCDSDLNSVTSLEHS